MAEPLEISIEVQGKTYTGSYRLEGDTVTVYYYGLERSEPRSGQPAEVVAEAMFRDLVATEPSITKKPTPNLRGPQFKS
jgi:hypothetical protein